MTGLLWMVSLLSTLWIANGQFANSFNYFGYLNTGGTGVEPRSSSIDAVETIVMPYKMVSQTQQGYVHGFRYNGDVISQPFQLQIWRRNQGSWQADGTWVNSYVTASDADLNGRYTLVYRTDTLYSSEGLQYVYLEEGVHIQENDFLGFSYLLDSPFKYDVAADCTTDYSYSRITLGTYPEVRNWYTFDSSRSVNECRTYAFGMLIEYTDTDDTCTRLNIVDEDSSYTMTSHDGYSSQNYDNDMDVCWIIHSYDADHYVTFTVETSDVFDLEYFNDCGYDRVTFYTKQEAGDVFVEQSEYCYIGQFGDEIIQSAPIVKIRFVTDYSRTAAGFRFTFRAVGSDYNPSADATEAPSAGANTNNKKKCKDSDENWEWQCLSRAEKALLVCIIILLIVCLLIFIFCIVWYCFYRSHDKVEPQKYAEKTMMTSQDGDDVTAATVMENTYSIPYEYEPYYQPSYETHIFEDR